MRRPLGRKPRVLFVASEAFPFAKMGGLGDVAGALPAALAERGLDVRVMIPAYPQAIAAAQTVSRGPPIGQLLGAYDAGLLETTLPGTDVRVWLVDCAQLFQRHGGPYCAEDGTDWPDNHLRFAALAQAAATRSFEKGTESWQPDIIHANDWHTGLIPIYLRLNREKSPPVVFTIHNLAYQGLFGADVISELGIPADFFTPDRCEFWGKFSFMKAGIVFANRVTTVSPAYARDIQTAAYGHGLDGVISRRDDDLIGIVNGIDDQVWNPEHDPLIAKRYSARTLADKAANKIVLRNTFGLKGGPAQPVIGFIGRFVEQKGIDILAAAIPEIAATGAQVVCLGEGERGYETLMHETAKQNAEHLGYRIAFNEHLAHLVIAGSDLIAMPSRFEPCGMTQLYAQRYGSMPVVHRVGGLADTVQDCEDGFTFEELSPRNLAAAIERALVARRDDRVWRTMQTHAMAKDLSWRPCADRYVGIYADLLSA